MNFYTKDVISALKASEEDLLNLESRIRQAQKEYGEVPDLAIMAYSYFHVPYGNFYDALQNVSPSTISEDITELYPDLFKKMEEL